MLIISAVQKIVSCFFSKYVMSLHIPAHLEVRDSHVSCFD